MTKSANFKRRVRARAAKTGESYSAARLQLDTTVAQARPVIGAAQLSLFPDPRSARQLAEGGEAVRALMHRAAAAGASLVHFPEGALIAPHKRVVSSQGPEIVAEADWSSVDRALVEAELDAVIETARQLNISTVVGGIHFSKESPRPTNALFVISGNGGLVGRYDERMLSRTKSTYMYRPGTRPFVFEANGVRFGCALGMESHYPELFGAYERARVDCVLLSTAGDPHLPAIFAVEAAGHAAATSSWVSYSGPAQVGGPPSGVIAPTGEWAARCDGASESIAFARIDRTLQANARAWRRVARSAAKDMP